MTDNEIIKALECCSKYPEEQSCSECPLNSRGADCLDFELGKFVLDLINRQQAEIERLNEFKKTVLKMKRCIGVKKEVEAEAVKEFADRLKEKLHLNGAVMGSNCAIVNDVDIDNLVKEMVGEG